MSACPACNVAVIPGYVKCPRCGAGLPRLTAQPSASGTAVEPAGGPRNLVFALGAGLVIAVAVIAAFARRGHEAPPANATSAPTEMQAVGMAPTPTDSPQIAATSTPSPTLAAADPREAANMFAELLKRQRLWGTASVAGTALVVRSGSCDDPAMAPLVAGQTPQLRAAGLTELRCLSQSGGVVFERDL